jgi:hypothetical protein
MILYTVFYKEPGIGRRWKRLDKVKGDGVLEVNSHRFFILEDESRIELPLSYCFKFGKERFYSIKDRFNQEARQDVRIKRT